MARDLIPPPSPAGRPPPDPPSEPAATEHLEEATRLTAQADRDLRQPAPFRGRFGFLFGVLATRRARSWAERMVGTRGGGVDRGSAEGGDDGRDRYGRRSFAQAPAAGCRA